MFEVYRDIPAKQKISTEVGENKTSSASQTTLSWNPIEGRFYRDSNGKIRIIYNLFPLMYKMLSRVPRKGSGVSYHCTAIIGL